MQTRFLFLNNVFFSVINFKYISEIYVIDFLSFVHLEEGGGERGGDVEARREALQPWGQAQSPRGEARQAGGTSGDQAGDTGGLPGLRLRVELHQSGNVRPLACCGPSAST